MLVVQLLIAVAVSAAVSEKNLDRLRNTASLNFTFYHLHQYPLADAFQVGIGFSRQGSNITQHLLDYRQFCALVRSEAKKWNAIVLDNQADSLSDIAFIDFDIKIRVQAALIVRIRGDDSLASFTDAINGLNFKVYWIDIVRYQKLNYEVQSKKAEEDAIKESVDLCRRMFGMSFKELVSFEVVSHNNTNNQTDEFLGDYFDVYEKIAERQANRQQQEDQIIYKCQIVCQKPHQTSNKQKSKKKVLNNKIDAEYAKKIAKSKEAEQPLRKEKQRRRKEVSEL